MTRDDGTYLVHIKLGLIVEIIKGFLSEETGREDDYVKEPVWLAWGLLNACDDCIPSVSFGDIYIRQPVDA